LGRRASANIARYGTISGMGFNKRQLAAGENVVFHTRAHRKAIVLPVLVLLIVGAGAVWLSTLTTMLWLQWTILIIAAVVIVIGVLVPILSWSASTDTLTTHRLISREGIIRRVRRDIPLERVHSVNRERGFIDRMLGSGTLIVQSAGADSDVVLEDIPRLKQRHMQIQEILMDMEIPAEGNPRVPRR